MPIAGDACSQELKPEQNHGNLTLRRFTVRFKTKKAPQLRSALLKNDFEIFLFQLAQNYHFKYLRGILRAYDFDPDIVESVSHLEPVIVLKIPF